MKKKLIIYLTIVKTRKFDFERFDAYEIQKSGTVDFEFHEIADFIYPGFANLFIAHRLRKKKIKIFSSFDNWKKEMINKKKIYKEKIIVYNTIENLNFQSFKVNHFLFKKKFKTIVASSLDHPEYFSNSLINRLKFLFKDLYSNKKKIRLFIQSYFFYNLGKILKIQPSFLLKCGSAYSPYESKTGIKILNGHSRDYNMFLKSKKKNL